jgi:hypothetical protein
MAEILAKCWQKWGDRRTNAPSDEQIDDYLKDYDVALPLNFVLNIPSIDDIIDTIHKTKNSCPGPDGVHYALLRAFSRKIANIIHRILVALSEGKKPPQEFNEVLQFYFPKGDSLLPQDTRPISVANTVSRIIAKILADSITPAAKKILRQAQKGFIPDRSINDHVEDITTIFYSNLEKKQQHYILFLDTEKAFDSLDHGFIFKVLKHIGCPPWYINCYQGLLHNIQGIPVLSAPTKKRIFLNRGVKQGCPMSPIIFALCFDVLLHKLSLLGLDNGDFAFADDLAISTSKFSTIVNCLHVIKSFSIYSGLGLNYKKSVILSTRRHNYSDMVVRYEHGFRDICFVDKVKYLGVWLGRNVTTNDIFREAYNKFVTRFGNLKDIIKHGKNLHYRIRICNTYLLPIFYYFAQFYIIPWPMVVKVKEMIRKIIVPYKGGVRVRPSGGAEG